MARDWTVLAATIEKLDRQRKGVHDEWDELQQHCKHPALPQRIFGEEYEDICPDCGFRAYCFVV